MLANARDDLWWDLNTSYTCPKKHFALMEIEAIGELPVDMDKARARFPKTRPGSVFLGWGGRGAAVNDISIGNAMCPSIHDWEKWYEPKGILPKEGLATIRSLSEILSDPV